MQKLLEFCRVKVQNRQKQTETNKHQGYLWVFGRFHTKIFCSINLLLEKLLVKKLLELVLYNEEFSLQNRLIFNENEVIVTGKLN